MGRITRDEANVLSKKLLEKDAVIISIMEEDISKLLKGYLLSSVKDKIEIIENNNLQKWVNKLRGINISNKDAENRLRNNGYRRSLPTIYFEADDRIYFFTDYVSIDEDSYIEFMTEQQYKDAVFQIERFVNLRDNYSKSVDTLQEYIYSSLRTHKRLITEFPQAEKFISDADLPMSKKQQQINEIKDRINEKP